MHVNLLLVLYTLEGMARNNAICHMSTAMKKKANEMYMRFQTRSDALSEKDPYTYELETSLLFRPRC